MTIVFVLKRNGMVYNAEMQSKMDFEQGPVV